MKNTSKEKVITIFFQLTHFGGSLGLTYDYMSNKESIGSSYTSLPLKRTYIWPMIALQNTDVMLCPEKAIVHAS